MPMGQQPREVPPHGPTTAKIAVIGEAPGAEEARVLRPFVGPAGQALDQCLQAGGLIRSEIYFTNVVKVRPPNNDIAPYFNGKLFTAAGREWCDKLYEELNAIQANVLVPVGNTALCALTGLTSILKYRGYVFESIGLRDCRKVIPTIHPAAALRGQYIYRYFISQDLRKAREQSLTRELKRPDRTLHTSWTFGQCIAALNMLRSAKRLSVDIEVMNFEVSCICFAPSPMVSYSIPLYDVWDEEQEITIWRIMTSILEDSSIVKVFQNGSFDTHFLFARCGILVQGAIEDTMIAHSIMWPEFPKGLAFLGSMFCGTQEYWKDVVRFKSIKKED